jgi:hypothetical protein
MRSVIGFALTFSLAILTSAPVFAHCDGWDGPVVKAAQKALETRNPALVLIWVQAKDEAEIRKAFDQTLVVRELSPQAKALADQFFFETLVRVHRAGEGAPYTGLKPAGTDVGPAIPAADKAIDTRSVEPVLKLLLGAVEERVREHFHEAIAAKGFHVSDVSAGRAYVKAYVEFLHLVERLYEAATTAPQGHVEKAETIGTKR